jgi:phosphoribosylformimino-5-aminoimidazole carboxamide ribotide isomerase
VVGTGTSTSFDVLPAIDLRDGQVVRLRQGDFSRSDVYSSEPTRVAEEFARAGARWIHVVDLDGALSGRRRQATAVAEIARVLATRSEPVRLQVAGGLRTAEDVAAALSLGAARVVIGTAALADPEFVATAIRRHGADRISIALDVRNGQAVGQGWVPGASGTPVGTALDRLAGVGVTTFAVTAIERDGELVGPDLDLLRSIVERSDAAVIASGGISSVADIEAVRAIGCAGVIVGRALYEGRFDLAEGLAVTG